MLKILKNKRGMSFWTVIFLLIIGIIVLNYFAPTQAESIIDKTFSFLRLGVDKVSQIDVANLTK